MDVENELGVWVVEPGENLWAIFKKLHQRGAGDAPSWGKFKENLKHWNPSIDIDATLQPGDRIKYLDPERKRMRGFMVTNYRVWMLAAARSSPGREWTPGLLEAIDYTTLTLGQIADLIDTGAAASHALSRNLKISGSELKGFNWGAFRKAYGQAVGVTTRAGQSTQWARFKLAGEIAEGAEMASKGFAYLDVVVALYTLGDAIDTGTGGDIAEASGELAASGLTAYLAAIGSRGSLVATPAWAAYYFWNLTEEGKHLERDAENATVNVQLRISRMNRFLITLSSHRPLKTGVEARLF